MKKILSVVLMAAMLLSVVGCGGNVEVPKATGGANTTGKENPKTQSVWEKDADISSKMAAHFSTEEWQEIKNYYNEYVYEIEMYDDEIYSNIRKEHSEYEDMSDEEFWDRVFVPLVQDKMLEKIKEEKLAIMRKPVLDFQNQLSCSLIDADTRGYGMNITKTSFFEFTVVDGLWKIKNSNPENFKSLKTTAEIEWTGTGKGRAGDDKSSTKNAEDIICIDLANCFPELNNCSMAVFVNGGFAESVYLTYETTEGIPELNELLKNGGWKNGDTHNWSSGEANVSTEGYVVLTVPELKMAE